MKKIEDVYAEELKDQTTYFCISDYQPMIESFEYEIILQIDDCSYSGDSRILFKDNDKFGYLIFGWGSCTGCDALQACSNIASIEQLQKDLCEDISWFNSAKECLEHFETKDWEGEYSWYYEETKEFVKKSKKIFIRGF